MLPKYKAKANDFLLKTFREIFLPFFNEKILNTPLTTQDLNSIKYTISPGIGSSYILTVEFPLAGLGVELGTRLDNIWVNRVFNQERSLNLFYDTVYTLKSSLYPLKSKVYSACRDIYYKYPNKGGGTFYTKGALVVAVESRNRSILFARNLEGQLVHTEDFPFD